MGGVISPLLANCYLPILDRIWQRRHLKGKLSAHLVRYADDFVVMCRKEVEEPLKVVRHVLERLDLSLNETKTHIVDATQASFNFLGFTIQMSRGAKTGKPYPNVRPADKSLKKIKARLTALTGRNLTPIPLERHRGKREPQPERLGELLPLPKLKSVDEQSQKPCGRPVAHPLDEAS